AKPRETVSPFPAWYVDSVRRCAGDRPLRSRDRCAPPVLPARASAWRPRRARTPSYRSESRRLRRVRSFQFLASRVDSRDGESQKRLGIGDTLFGRWQSRTTTYICGPFLSRNPDGPDEPTGSLQGPGGQPNSWAGSILWASPPADSDCNGRMGAIVPDLPVRQLQEWDKLPTMAIIRRP